MRWIFLLSLILIGCCASFEIKLKPDIPKQNLEYDDDPEIDYARN